MTTRLLRWKLRNYEVVRHFNEAMRGAGNLPHCEGVTQHEWTMLWETWKGQPRPYTECLYASPEELKAFRAWVDEDDGTPYECACYTCTVRRTHGAKAKEATP